MYQIPEEFKKRIHHIRPRFKNDVENVLFYMAGEISKLEPSEHADFAEKLNEVIRLYPENNSKVEKTINNWRTEISSLFGLIETEGDKSKPGEMAIKLAEKQDLVEFFRYFLYYFQYPGGHLKPDQTLELIKSGVKFKPAPYILAVMLEGQKILKDKTFGLTKEEATHCIFNDLRVTRDQRSPRDTAILILENRDKDLKYDSQGDVVRYAGDILDYMELADLVKLRPNYQYYPKMADLETIQAFIQARNNFFQPYEELYTKEDLSIEDVKSVQESWFHYVNNHLDAQVFEANILSIVEDFEDEKESVFIQGVLSKMQKQIDNEEGIKTKEIGDVGEAIVIEHEKVRLINLEREDIIHLIKKIPETFAVGYDISSFDGEGGIRRFIEVKTTISRGKLASNSFRMTHSEWSSAETHRQHYYIYRLMISSTGVSLFLIDDPVGKYKNDLLTMVPRDGADIKYSEKSGYWETLLA